jgi:hypothetical protein
MNPPVGEGFNLDTGQPAFALGDGRIYLRSFGDDMKSVLRCYRRERAAGYEHPEWLAWVRQFADWLLTQEQPDAGFPRSWDRITHKIADASTTASYSPVPFLVMLSAETNNPQYRDAAVRAAEMIWSHQSSGKFTGGTIDNPNVLDKEAATLSLEAYMALFRGTHDPRWLQRATVAADFAETWIYIWNVPMPTGEPDSELHWKQGVPTAGTQLIATGHSLVDEYMAFNVDEYAALASWNHDPHFQDVSTLLLQNTKLMISLPEHPYDLRGFGWQQEHFSFAPVRGQGLHRLWLPWVATSQLKGIFGFEEFAHSRQF